MDGGDRPAHAPRRRLRPILTIASLAVAVAGVAALLTVLLRPASPEPTAADERPTPAPSVTLPSFDPSDPLAGADVETIGGPAADDCPADHTCSTWEVTCPAAPGPTAAVIAVAEARGDRRGVLVLFSGGSGDTWWDGGSPEAAATIDVLRDAGIDAVQVRWIDGWSATPRDEGPGLAALACRSAAVIRAIHDDRWGAGSEAEAHTCGFCVSGNSSGASQVAYALTYYGLDDVVDVAVMTSGPPHAGLARGCLAAAGDDLRYDESQTRDIDEAYGLRRDGPCERRDPSFVETWDADDVASAAGDQSHPDTRIVLILGGEDTTIAVAHARLYHERLESDGSNVAELVEVPDMGHRIERSADGLDALVDAVTRG